MEYLWKSYGDPMEILWNNTRTTGEQQASNTPSTRLNYRASPALPIRLEPTALTPCCLPRVRILDFSERGHSCPPRACLIPLLPLFSSLPFPVCRRCRVRPARGEPDSSAVALSVRLFQRLLAAYPKEYRREYGPAMAQLFRDQCRDAWRHGRGWGLTGLWLRVLPDLVKTSVLEHLSTFKERKTMLERIGMLLRPQAAPWRVFIKVFGAVFLLVVATSTLITLILPESYSSTARIMPGWTVNDRAGQLEFESIQSEAVLGKVIDALDLNRAWGNKYAGGTLLKTSESLALLKSRLDLRPVRGTTLIEIRAFSDDASEAAKLANAIVDTYREARSSAFSIEIVDKAVPGLRPVRPNKRLNIAQGILGGLLLALVAGAGIAGLAAWLGRRSRGTGAPPGTGAVPPPDLPRAADGGARRPLA